MEYLTLTQQHDIEFELEVTVTDANGEDVSFETDVNRRGDEIAITLDSAFDAMSTAEFASFLGQKVDVEFDRALLLAELPTRIKKKLAQALFNDLMDKVSDE